MTATCVLALSHLSPHTHTSLYAPCPGPVPAWQAWLQTRGRAAFFAPPSPPRALPHVAASPAGPKGKGVWVETWERQHAHPEHKSAAKGKQTLRYSATRCSSTCSASSFCCLMRFASSLTFAISSIVFSFSSRFFLAFSRSSSCMRFICSSSACVSWSRSSSSISRCCSRSCS